MLPTDPKYGARHPHLRHMSARTLLFICTGNTCRSPLAEGLLRHALGDDSSITVKSAGIAAMDGDTANPETLAVLNDVGVDLSSHRSQMTDRELVSDATWVVAMTRNHLDAVAALFPEADERLFLLSDFIDEPENIDVPDPIGMGRSAYLRTRDVIVDAIPGLLKYINPKSAD